MESSPLFHHLVSLQEALLAFFSALRENKTLSSKFCVTTALLIISCGALLVRCIAPKRAHSTSPVSTRELKKWESDQCSKHNQEASEHRSRWLRLKSLSSRTALPEDSDPGLLKKHTTYQSYITSRAIYPKIRTFFCPHPHINKLPTQPTPLPLIVFVHGLGGSVAQFHLLLKSLVNIAPCLAIDFPGCGLSSFSPKDWSAYSFEALTELLAVAVEQHRDVSRNQDVVLVGHSLGSAISATLASSTSPIASKVRNHIIGLVTICPPGVPPSQKDARMFRRLLHVPGFAFDLWRKWDSRGGINSASISRFVGTGAHIETRKLQYHFNRQSRTPVFRRMAWGILPEFSEDGMPNGGIPGERIWAGVEVPILLIGGESDTVTKAEEVKRILMYFGDDLGEDTNLSVDSSTSYDKEFARELDIPCKPVESGSTLTAGSKRIVKVFIFPAPATHALLYDRNTYRTLSGLVQNFLPKYVDHRLSLGWQLQTLTTSGKWDVKNLQKWKAVEPVSSPIGGTFHAIKTLREVDEHHNPTKFAETWKGKIFAVIDISHESPVYDPAHLERGGIRYIKFPTVSKIPPTTLEVQDFIALVDRLKKDMNAEKSSEDGEKPKIAVHCHYGYNRTGFFLASYLIENKGYDVQEALDEFGKNRPPGVKHRHFIDTLFLRYYPGLQAANSS
ncbi:hypothetical protein KEM54_006015 [Ascosphaera aggregata]|nr:hypothetical protein KEM54_006015 [Ascosphaera aggregata]